MANRLKVWQCPECTWFRAKHDDAEHDGQKIVHPVYGTITVGALYDLEVAVHDCELTAQAREKFGIPTDIVYQGKYEQREVNG